MTTVEIQKVTTAGLHALQAIGRQTFYETFSADNTEENMKKYLNDRFSSDTLASELSDTGSEFYFALLGKKVIGYLKINSGQSQTELKETASLEIERIYVLKEFQGNGAGQKLFEKAIHIAREKNAVTMWLGVWEKNQKAINFYQKNGFVEFDRHFFTLGNDKQTDVMMKRPVTDSR